MPFLCVATSQAARNQVRRPRSGVTHEIRASVSAAWRAKGSAFPDGGEAVLEALITELASIEDPRCEWKVEHRLLDILVIAVCAVLGEAESFEDIALTAGARRRGSGASSPCRTASPRTTPSGAC